MTELEIIDTAVKIGLGSIITGFFAYFLQRTNISASVSKDKLENNRKILMQISADIEEINHLVLKVWSIFDFEIKKDPIDKENIYLRLTPLKASLFNDFQLLSKNEGLLLLYGYKDQQQCLRKYGEFLVKFNSYTYFNGEKVTQEKSTWYRGEILRLRYELYESLHRALSQ